MRALTGVRCLLGVSVVFVSVMVSDGTLCSFGEEGAGRGWYIIIRRIRF